MTTKKSYKFWLGEFRGLLRQDGDEYPEAFRRGCWRVGVPYDVDAITGMGEDAYSCGEWADELTQTEADEYAAKHGIDLYAPVTEEKNEPAK